MENKKPLIYLVLKLVGFVGMAVFITGIVLFVTGFDDFESPKFMIGMMLFPFGLVIGVGALVTGFGPEIARMKTKNAKYIQTQNKEDLAEIATNSAEIMSEAITKTTQAVNKGLDQTKFCKHCGAEIDEDSAFCSKCGKPQ